MTSTRPRRRRMSFGERRENIVAAACAVIGELGVDAFRIVDVANTAGISQPLVSRHFSSREDLLVEAFVYADRIGVQALEARDVRATGSGAQRTLAWLGSLVDDREPDLVANRRMWNQVWGCRPLSPALNAVVRESQRTWLAKIESLVRLAQSDGSASADVDPARAALHLATLADGIPPALAQGTMTTGEARGLLRDVVCSVIGADLQD